MSEADRTPRGVHDSREARSWSEWLPRLSYAKSVGDRRRRQVSASMETVRERWLAQIEQSISEWWQLPGQSSDGLEIGLVTPKQERHEITLYQRVLTFGSAEDCEVALQSNSVGRRQGEITIDDQHLWYRQIDPQYPTQLNGEVVNAGEAKAIGTGDHLEMGGFVITIGMQRVRPVQIGCELSLSQALHFSGLDAVSVLGGDESLWVRLGVVSEELGPWEGYLKVPSRWLSYAYSHLGWALPERYRRTNTNEVDRGVTAFLLEQMASEFGRRSGLDLNLSAILDVGALRQMIPAVNDWEGVRFRMLMGGQGFESEVVWPAEERSVAGQFPWVSQMTFAVSAVAGLVRLSPEDLGGLTEGDIVLPDHWFDRQEGDLIDSETEPGQEVLLALQNWTRSARLIDRPDGVAIHITSPAWTMSAKGGLLMPTDTEVPDPHEADFSGGSDSNGRSDVSGRADTPLEEPVNLAEELEVTLAFELDRMSVSMKDLTSWEEGSIVQLDRRPNDEVKILLKQGNGHRLLGYGRAIVIEDKLGIQIQKWLGDKQG